MADDPQTDDGQLVEMTRGGDHDAYRRLVARYQGHVYGLAYSLVGDWTEAQDIAQETFIRAYSNLDKLRDPSRFAAWLRRVTFGVAMNWLRAFRPGVFAKLDGKVDLDTLEVPDFQPSPPEAAVKRELADAVLAAVASLPPKYRVPLTMFHLDGLSYQKVADFLDIPLGTAKSMIHRAKAKLKAALPASVAREMTPAVQEVFNEHKLPVEFAEKVIEGVDGWAMGEKGSSIHAAQAEIMRAIGEDVTYTELLGTSALAFRLQVHKELCPSSPHPFCGYQCVAGSNRALPWKFRVFEIKPDDPNGMAEARKAITASIAEGRPVQYGSEEDGLIVGYRSSGDQWLCLHPMRKGGSETFVEEDWPWGIVVFTERKASMPARRELAISALREALHMSQADNAGDYVLGFKAWELWLTKLAELETLDEKSHNKSMMGNSWIYTTLVEYRGIAAKYLESVADEFGADTAAHLRSAAAIYSKMSSEILIDTDHCALDVAPTPWYLKNDQKWSKAMRTDQAGRLTEALKLERQAIAELDEAITTAKSQNP